jgi:hypothetical protein
LPDLSSDARTLLEAGKATEPLPPRVAARVWGKLAVTTAPPASASLHVATAKTMSLVKLLGVSLGIVGVGAVATVAVVHLRRRPPPPMMFAPQPEQAEAPPVAVPIPSTLPPAPNNPVEPPPASRAAPAVSAHSPSKSELPARFPDAPDSDLAAERSLIARARSSLQGGSPLDALATLQVHEERFRTGALAQEREALRIQALIASGNRPAAEAAAARFERDYPQSLMGPAVRAALSVKP